MKFHLVKEGDLIRWFGHATGHTMAYVGNNPTIYSYVFYNSIHSGGPTWPIWFEDETESYVGILVKSNVLSTPTGECSQVIIGEKLWIVRNIDLLKV